jgi:hypothetical protein
MCYNLVLKSLKSFKLRMRLCVVLCMQYWYRVCVVSGYVHVFLCVSNVEFIVERRD